MVSDFIASLDALSHSVFQKYLVDKLKAQIFEFNFFLQMNIQIVLTKFCSL